MHDDYSDLLICIRPHDGTAYPVEAALSDGSVYEGALALTEADLQKLLSLDLEPNEYGLQLFEILFRGRIGTAYAVASGLARKQSAGRLRVRLLLPSDLPVGLQTLKWERLCQEEAGLKLPLAISELTPFSRHSALSRQEPTPLDAPYIHLLIVLSSPSNLASYGLVDIDVSAELRRLALALKEVLDSQRCRVTIMPGREGKTLAPDVRQMLKSAHCTIISGPSTLDAISEQMRGQHVLHFLGHGHYLQGEGALYLEEPDGTVGIVQEDELAARLGSTQLQLVFLAACESARRDEEVQTKQVDTGDTDRGLATTLVAAGIPAVVAMQAKVSVDGAYKLTGEFYRRLFLEHGSVDLALNQARKLLYDGSDDEWATPVLYTRLPSGQLMHVNPLFAALQLASTHTDYAIFQDTTYISLPIHAMHINSGQQFTYFDAPDVQATGTVGLIDAAWQWLSDPTPPGSFLMILGGPGTSKSTQLKQLSWKTIVNGLAWEGKDRSLPIYLDQQPLPFAGAISAELLEQQILEKLKHFWGYLSASRLTHLPDFVRLRVFVNGGDALPEVAADLVEQMARLAHNNPRHQFVLAIQPITINWAQFDGEEIAPPHVLAIQPLAQGTLRHFLEAQDGFGRKLLDAIQDSYLFDLASIPYFAIKMCNRARTGTMPVSRTDFLKQVIDAGVAKLPPGEGMRANALHTLRTLAWEMQWRRDPLWSINDAFVVMQRVRENRGYDLETLYSVLVKNDLLQPVGEDSLRFAYRSLQAYLCAEAILDLPDRDRLVEEIIGTLGFPSGLRWWQETVVILCGLLAGKPQPEALRILRHLLEPLVFGTNLLEGEAIFLAARCLVECHQHGHKRDLQDLDQHVILALRWRADSGNETEWMQRLQATQLLAHLAMPQVTIELAQKAYEKVRKNLVNEWDYEFSSVRFAAAIGLTKLGPAAAARSLAQINPELPALFKAWKGRNVDAVIKFSQMSAEHGLQGIAALALGDLHGRLQHNGNKADRAFERTLRHVLRCRYAPVSALAGCRCTLAIGFNPDNGTSDLSSPAYSQCCKDSQTR